MALKVSRWTKVALGTVGVVIGVMVVFWALNYLIARPIPNVDVSAQPKYSAVLGKRFRTQQDLIAIGCTMDRNYKKQIDYIALRIPPGFSGPEVVAKGQLPKGSVLDVRAVLKADAWLLNRIQYAVIRVDARPPLEGQMVLDVDDGSRRNFGLPEAVFSLINANS